MRDSGGGAIVNVSSVGGLTAHYDAVYAASKWGLRGLTKRQILREAEVVARLRDLGFELAPNTPEQFRAFIRAE